MRRSVAAGAPVVVKVGSSSLTAADGGLSEDAINRVVGEVERLWQVGHPTVLVTSAAVAAGLPALRLDEPPQDLPGLQVAAAVGQGRLMTRYARSFEAAGRIVGQVLLTRDVLANRSQYLHAREALERMLELGVVPIVNENDTVVVDELSLGDNDRLAAIVSHLIGAGMLVILTDTKGLYSDDPRLARVSGASHCRAPHGRDPRRPAAPVVEGDPGFGRGRYEGQRRKDGRVVGNTHRYRRRR